MAILSVALSILMVVFIRHVSENVETYSNAGNLVVRSIIFLFGISSGTLGGFFFSRNVAEPSWLFGSGFVLGPLLAEQAVHEWGVLPVRNPCQYPAADRDRPLRVGHLAGHGHAGDASDGTARCDALRPIPV